MARVKIADFASDPAGNVVGGTGYEVNVYEAETTTARTLYLGSSGVDTVAQPLTPNAGTETTLTAQAAPAATSLTVASTTGFAIGQVVHLQSGANRAEVIIKAIPDGVTLTLFAAVGGAFTYPVSSTVGGEEQTGHWQAWVDDTLNTEAVYKNVSTGKTTARVFFQTRLPANYQTVQDEGTDLTTRSKLNFQGPGVKAQDNSGSARTDVLVDDYEDLGNWTGAVTVDVGNGKPNKKATLTGNVTGITISNSVDGGWYHFHLLQDVTGGRTVVWPATFKWPGGTAPTLSAANKVDKVTFQKVGTDFFPTSSLNH